MNPTEIAASLPPIEALAALTAEADELRERLAEVERIRAATEKYLASMGVVVEPAAVVEPAEAVAEPVAETVVEPPAEVEPVVEPVEAPVQAQTSRDVAVAVLGEAVHTKLLHVLSPNADPTAVSVSDLDVEHFRLGMRTPSARTGTVCEAIRTWACSTELMALTADDVQDVVTRLAFGLMPGLSTTQTRRLIDGGGDNNPFGLVEAGLTPVGGGAAA